MERSGEICTLFSPGKACFADINYDRVFLFIQPRQCKFVDL